MMVVFYSLNKALLFLGVLGGIEGVGPYEFP